MIFRIFTGKRSCGSLRDACRWLFNNTIGDWIRRRSASLSQAGQDLWVYGEFFNEAKGEYFVDIGANDGITLSNTYLLEKRYKWKGLCIEGNPEIFRKLAKIRTVQCVNQCVDSDAGIVKFALDGLNGGIVSADCDNVSEAGVTTYVEARSLKTILDENNAPSEIDYLSIDIEGAEDRALLGFPFEEYRFNCITIERPSHALRDLLLDHGYLLVKEMPGLDSFYIHQKFVEDYHKNMHAFGAKRFWQLRWR